MSTISCIFFYMDIVLDTMAPRLLCAKFWSTATLTCTCKPLLHSYGRTDHPQAPPASPDTPPPVHHQLLIMCVVICLGVLDTTEVAKEVFNSIDISGTFLNRVAGAGTK